MDVPVEMMNIIDERTRFERFPPEVLYLIFEYLSGNDILQSFRSLSTRLDSHIANFPLSTIDLSEWKLGDIIHLFKTSFDYLSTFALGLKLSNRTRATGSCTGTIEFIFSSLLDSYQLNSLFTHLQQIILIRPIIDTSICLPDFILQAFFIYSSENRIIFKRRIPSQNIASISLCNSEMIRSLLRNNGGVYDELLLHYQNPCCYTIIPFVRHLKLYMNDFNQQWTHMSPLVVHSLIELTLIVIDDHFEHYDGRQFSTLFPNLSSNCNLHFYLQLLANPIFVITDIDILRQSFQDAFYVQHRSDVTITYCQDFRRLHQCPLLIYTSPFCSTELKLVDYPRVIGTCSDYNNLTRLIFDPCSPSNVSPLYRNNQFGALTNLTSLEFLHQCDGHWNLMTTPFLSFFRQITPDIRHIHTNSPLCLLYLTKYSLPQSIFENLRYLDITDNDVTCPILCDILNQYGFFRNLFHLNISGLCRLQNSHIEDLGVKFRRLQTLQFPMKLHSSFNEQLDTIGQSILIKMSSHLHYLRIHFEQEKLLNLSIVPSESNLSEWLGRNQGQLFHVQAIELNRNELSAWM